MMQYTRSMGEHSTSMEYVPALDGLRALAAVAVVAFHVRLAGFSGGFVGVEVFFVLSGYLITSLLRLEIETTGRLRITQFWWRRIVRLYPELLALLVCCMVASAALYPDRAILDELTASALYVSNYFAATGGDLTFTRHTWSLAVEMQFYVMWPVLLLVLARFSRSTTVLCLTLFFVLAIWWRMHASWMFGIDYAYQAADTRMSGLIIGSLLGFWRWTLPRHVANAMALMAMLALGIAVSHLSFADRGGWAAPIIDVASAVLILALSVRECWLTQSLSHPILVRLGIWSYGIYLWHYPMARVVRTHVEPSVAFITVLAGSIVLAAISHRFVLRPTKRLLARRLMPSRVAPEH